MSIRSEVRDGVARIVIDRPEKKNALTAAMYAAFDQALAAAEADPAVRVISVAGAGGCFSAGNDIEDFLANPPLTQDAPVFRFLMRLAGLTKPLVARVAGPAVGVGTTFLLHCDLVLAATDARFAMSFIQLGLVPEAGSSLLLPRLAGLQGAAQKLMFGDPFDAAEAQRIGLVAEVVPAGQLDATAEARLARLVALPAAALRATKALLRQGLEAELRQRIADEAAIFAQRLQSPEAREAFAAFLERRKPDFSRFS